jgi:4-aminobutyrate aminotransferase-like enzyme
MVQLAERSEPAMAVDMKKVASTAAELLARNPAVDDAIDGILAALREAQSSITAVRQPQAERVESFQSWIARQEGVKGRPPYYPYIGSGIGSGPLVELLDGSVKWDMINGIGVHMFGHTDQETIAAALRGAMADTIMQGNLQFNADSIEFGELLIEEASKGSRLRHAFLINTGAMANESALKVCFHKNFPADRVIAFENCFMGRTLTMAQIGDSAAFRVGLPHGIHVDYMPFYDGTDHQGSIDRAVEQLEKYVERYPGRHACFVFELVQGEGGFNVAPREFFIPLMEICRKNSIAVFVDEIQTFGRTTRIFYYDVLALGEYVDVLTLGKMSQACATMFTEDYNPKPGLLSATFLGSTVALRAGMSILSRLRDGGYYGDGGRIAKLQGAFRRHVKLLVERRRDIFPALDGGQPLYGGVGGMMRFTPFAGDKKKVLDACNALFHEGVIAFYCGHGPYHIRFLPAVGVFEPEMFDDVFEIVERGLDRVAKG